MCDQYRLQHITSPINQMYNTRRGGTGAVGTSTLIGDASPLRGVGGTPATTVEPPHLKAKYATLRELWDHFKGLGEYGNTNGKGYYKGGLLGYEKDMGGTKWREAAGINGRQWSRATRIIKTIETVSSSQTDPSQSRTVDQIIDEWETIWQYDCKCSLYSMEEYLKEHGFIRKLAPRGKQSHRVSSSAS